MGVYGCVAGCAMWRIIWLSVDLVLLYLIELNKLYTIPAITIFVGAFLSLLQRELWVA